MKKQQVIIQIKWFDNSIGQYAHTRQRNHIKHRIRNQYSPYRIRIASHHNCGRKSGVWWCRGGLWNVKSEMWWNENGITSTHTHTHTHAIEHARTHTHRQTHLEIEEPSLFRTTSTNFHPFPTNQREAKRKRSEWGKCSAATSQWPSAPANEQNEVMSKLQKRSMKESLPSEGKYNHNELKICDYNTTRLQWKAGKSWYLRRYTTSIQKLKKRKRKIDKKPKQKKVEKRNVDVSCLVFASLVPTSNFQILIIFDIESLMVNFSKIKFKVFKNHEFS